jgi:hypothetical protein
MKIGAGHFAAMMRKGLSELAQYLMAFNQAGTHVIEDAGVWPNQTQGEIASAREGSATVVSLADLRAHAEQKAKEANQRMDHGHPNDHGGNER